MRLKKLMGWAVISLISSSSVWAQANLEINLSSGNQPLPFVPLKVKNPAIGFDQSQTTNAQGKARFSSLSTSGTYTIEVPESQQYQGQRISGIRLISNQTKTVNLNLKEKAGAMDSVVIKAEEYQSINASNAEVASELSEREIYTLPIEGRDITRALYRLPNISQATGFYPEAPNVAINGANPLFTNYQIDGLENNENFLGGQRFAMPIGFTQNITALTNNFSAEHGLTTNGIINLTTKSGTNEVDGEVFAVTRPGPVIDAASPYAQRDLSGNQVKDGFQRYQTGFGVGGPIKKDQTFFYLNVEQTIDLKDNLLNVPQLGINETVRGINRFTYLSGKLDHFWSDQLHSSLRVNTGLVSIERQGGGLEGGVSFPSAANEQDRNSVNVAWKNSYSKGNFHFESNYQYGRFRWNYAQPKNQGRPDVSILDPMGQNMAFIGHPGYVFDEAENAFQMQQKVGYKLKNHHLKAGIQLRHSRFELFGGGNPNGSYLVQLDSSGLTELNNQTIGTRFLPSDVPNSVEVLNYNVELRPNSFGKNQRIFSAYLEDQWSLTPRLNANIGIRYDYDNLSALGGSNGDYNNLAPRLSANYRLTENASIRAGYGIYYDKILYAVISDALQQNQKNEDYLRQLQELSRQGILPAETDLNALTFRGNQTATIADVDYLQGPTASALSTAPVNTFSNERRILNPNGLDNPYAHQMMVGFQQKLNEQTLFYADAIHNRSYNLYRLRNLNAPAPYPIPNEPAEIVVRSTAQADSTRPIPIYNNAYSIIDGDTLQGVARNIMMTETAGRSNYYALNLTLNKEKGEDKYAYRISYTLSYLENNTGDINFRAMDANDFEAEWGPAINDRRHLLNAIFYYYPIKNLSLSAAALIQSGQPINRIPNAENYGTTDLNGDGRGFGDAYVGNSDRAPGEKRNSDRLPGSTTFDLAAYYHLPLSEKSKLELGATVFNVLNAENLSGYSNNATQSNQIQPGQKATGVLIRKNAAPPRQFQFSARYLF